jgi:hypothetical protein
MASEIWFFRPVLPPGVEGQLYQVVPEAAWGPWGVSEDAETRVGDAETRRGGEGESGATVSGERCDGLGFGVIDAAEARRRSLGAVLPREVTKVRVMAAIHAAVAGRQMGCEVKLKPLDFVPDESQALQEWLRDLGYFAGPLVCTGGNSFLVSWSGNGEGGLR